MDAYPKSMYKLNPNITKRIFANIADDERLIDEILNDKSEELLDGKSERIVSIYLFLDDIRNKLNKLKGKIMSYDDANYILNIMILVNSEITQYYMDKAQKDGRFSYENEYSQSSIIINYIKVIRDDMQRREKIQEIYPNKEIIESKELKIVSECDLSIIEKHLEYLVLINTLMCMQISPFFNDKDRIIAEWFLCCFGDIFTNCMIEGIYMEPNTSYSEYENGSRTTTKMEIFFSQSNEDRYQLRLDFPHDDKECIHFNLYEPFKIAAYPIDYLEYNMLIKQYGDVVKNLFYHCGNRMWFKSQFKDYIDLNFTNNIEARKALLNLFETHTHSPVCDNSVSENDMKNFLNELFSAISIMDMSHSRYLKPKNIDENKELEYITLEKNVRNAAYKIDEAYLYNLQTGTIPAKLKEDLANIEIKLTNVLTEYYAKYTHEELNDLSLLELLMLVRECMIEHS